MQKVANRLTILLATAVFILISIIIFLAVIPQEKDKFTEFYILNVNGKAADYQRQVKLGDTLQLIAGVVNHEGTPINYRIVLKAGDAAINLFETGILQNNEKWENKINFTPDMAGKNQKVNFYLFIANESNPHIKDPLTLIIDVARP
jgi:uncharacterized membrane protein